MTTPREAALARLAQFQQSQTTGAAQKAAPSWVPTTLLHRPGSPSWLQISKSDGAFAGNLKTSPAVFMDLLEELGLSGIALRETKDNEYFASDNLDIWGNDVELEFDGCAPWKALAILCKMMIYFYEPCRLVEYDRKESDMDLGGGRVTFHIVWPHFHEHALSSARWSDLNPDWP